MPRDVEAMLLNTRGAVYRELHMLQSARDCAERSIKIMPNQRHVYNMLSAIYRQLGDTKAAIRTMELANALPPDIEANK